MCIFVSNGNSVLLNWVNRNSVRFDFLFLFRSTITLRVRLSPPETGKYEILIRCDIFMCPDPKRNESKFSVARHLRRTQLRYYRKNAHRRKSCKCRKFCYYYRFEWDEKKKTKHTHTYTYTSARISIYWMTHRISISIRFAPKTAQKASSSFEAIGIGFLLQMSTTHWINFHSGSSDQNKRVFQNKCEILTPKHVMPRKPN